MGGGGSIEGEKARPEGLFGGSIEGTGEIVENQEFGLANKHPGGGNPLQLATGEAHFFGADECIESISHGYEILLKTGKGNRGVEELLLDPQTLIPLNPPC